MGQVLQISHIQTSYDVRAMRYLVAVTLARRKLQATSILELREQKSLHAQTVADLAPSLITL